VGEGPGPLPASVDALRHVQARGLACKPLGATIYSDRVHEVISAPDPQAWFTHGFTYSGHPVCCAAALKNIEIITADDLLGNARAVGDYFETRLKELAALPLVGDVRGRRFMMCVEYVADKSTRAPLPEPPTFRGASRNAAKRRDCWCGRSATSTSCRRR
jgi:adenosylmethionine-8-amino-7-oxononanoate aminotransferase